MLLIDKVTSGNPARPRANEFSDGLKLFGEACVLASQILSKLDGGDGDLRLTDSDTIDRVIRQAGGCLAARVRYEKPNGESEIKMLRGIDINVKAKYIKRDIEKKFDITKNKIQVYLEHGKQEMPDEPTLYELGIIDDIELVVRDGSLTYEFY